jgi:hypothetical protein
MTESKTAFQNHQMANNGDALEIPSTLRTVAEREISEQRRDWDLNKE